MAGLEPGEFSSDEWVDIHAHVAGLARFGVDATRFGLEQGVGVLVDAGSAPSGELAERLPAVQDETPTQVLAWANICAEGIAGQGCEGHDISGCGAHAALRAMPGRVVGIKLQASRSRLGERALEAIGTAKEVAGAFGVPLMVHVGNGPPSLPEVLRLLRAGDIVTHFAHGKPRGALLEGEVHPAMVEARARGVLFDIGHGAGSFSLAVMERLLAEGFAPDIISTDLHGGSAERPVGSLADCMSKLLGLGMSREAVVQAVTGAPRRALGLGPAERRTRYRLLSQAWEAVDSTGAVRRLAMRIVPVGVSRDG